MFPFRCVTTASKAFGVSVVITSALVGHRPPTARWGALRSDRVALPKVVRSRCLHGEHL